MVQTDESARGSTEADFCWHVLEHSIFRVRRLVRWFADTHMVGIGVFGSWVVKKFAFGSAVAAPIRTVTGADTFSSVWYSWSVRTKIAGVTLQRQIDSTASGLRVESISAYFPDFRYSLSYAPTSSMRVGDIGDPRTLDPQIAFSNLEGTRGCETVFRSKKLSEKYQKSDDQVRYGVEADICSSKHQRYQCGPNGQRGNLQQTTSSFL